MARIIEARMEEIFSLVNRELKKIDRERLLPSGVVLVGGGARIPGIIDLAKDKLKLPVQLGYPQEIDGLVDKVDDPTFATAVGLIFWALEIRGEKKEGRLFLPDKMPSSINTVNKIKGWFRNFLP